MIRSRQGRVGRRRPSRGRPADAAALACVVAAAAALRLWSLQGARLNPFYDAAVRSMGLSWHNFFFGALDPGGRISVDKPPIDLWLQVASTKLVGFNTTGLLLPEALGGIAAAALLFATLRPVFGRGAALLAGLALAVLPISVVTSRSDTMDSVMMALLIAALWASVRGLRTRRIRWVVLAAAIVGLAFNVKLSEALVPLPALALVWLGVPRGWRRLPLTALGAAVALVAVGMAWIVIASLTSAAHRPYPIGSRNGSIYAAVFVYNGVERLNGTSAQVAPVASASQPGPGRLLTAAHPFYGSLIGLELVAAIALGVACAVALRGARQPARRLARLRAPGLRRRRSAARGPVGRAGRLLAWLRVGAQRRRRSTARGLSRREPVAAGSTRRVEPAADSAIVVFDPRRRRRELALTAAAAAPPRESVPDTPAPPEAAPSPPDPDAHARRWLVVGLVAWLVTAAGLLSFVRDLEPRYLEAVSPALAGLLGIGGAALVRRAPERRVTLALAAALVACAAFTLGIAGGIPGAALAVCLAATGLAAMALATRPTIPGRLRLRGVLLGLTSTVALLAAPVGVSINQITANATAAGTVGAGDQFAPYLHAHRHGAYYEVASASVYAVTTLIAADAQPVLVLNDFHGPIVTLAKLMDLIRRHAVRQIIISHACHSGPHCPLTTRWSLKHAREVVKGGLWEYVLPFTLPPRCVDRPRAPGCPKPAKPAKPAKPKPAKPQPRPVATRPVGPFGAIVLGGPPVAGILVTP